MKCSLAVFLLVLLVVGTALAEAPISAATAARLLHDDFFVFDNGVGRGEWTPEQQAETLARLGFAGIGYSGTDALEGRLAAFKKHGVRVFNLYVPCFVDAERAYGEDLKEAIAALKGSDVTIWLTVQGKADNDDNAIRTVSEIADLAAASGLRVALYPHAGFFVEDIEDALRIVRSAKRRNLGVTFNLCHELKAGNEARFDALLKEALPHLFVVSINGADHTGNWDRLIQPLGRGVFDVEGLLRKILALGYGGPIGLQCYAVPGDTLGNLEHNIAQWKEMIARIAKSGG
jgi:sugar phosphate isomerase/epimerase